MGQLEAVTLILLIVTWEMVLGLASMASTDIEGLLGDLELPNQITFLPKPPALSKSFFNE